MKTLLLCNFVTLSILGCINHDDDDITKQYNVQGQLSSQTWSVHSWQSFHKRGIWLYTAIYLPLLYYPAKKYIKINKNQIRSLLIQPRRKLWAKARRVIQDTLDSCDCLILNRKQFSVQIKSAGWTVQNSFKDWKVNIVLVYLDFGKNHFSKVPFKLFQCCGHPGLALGAYFTLDTHTAYAHLQGMEKNDDRKNET